MSEELIQSTKPMHVLPGCSVFVRSDEKMSIEQFFAVVLQMANSNPGAIVDFQIDIKMPKLE